MSLSCSNINKDECPNPPHIADVISLECLDETDELYQLQSVSDTACYNKTTIIDWLKHSMKSPYTNEVVQREDYDALGIDYDTYSQEARRAATNARSANLSGLSTSDYMEEMRRIFANIHAESAASLQALAVRRRELEARRREIDEATEAQRERESRRRRDLEARRREIDEATEAQRERESRRRQRERESRRRALLRERASTVSTSILLDAGRARKAKLAQAKAAKEAQAKEDKKAKLAQAKASKEAQAKEDKKAKLAQAKEAQAKEDKKAKLARAKTDKTDFDAVVARLQSMPRRKRVVVMKQMEAGLKALPQMTSYGKLLLAMIKGERENIKRETKVAKREAKMARRRLRALKRASKASNYDSTDPVTHYLYQHDENYDESSDPDYVVEEDEEDEDYDNINEELVPKPDKKVKKEKKAKPDKKKHRVKKVKPKPSALTILDSSRPCSSRARATDRYRKDELIDIAKTYGLPTTGTIDNLCQVINAYRGVKPVTARKMYNTKPVKKHVFDKSRPCSSRTRALTRYTKPELVKLAKKLKLSTSGTMTDLCDRIGSSV